MRLETCIKILFACVFIYNQKGAMPDSIPFAIKSPSLNGMKFKHKRESLCLVFYLYFRNMYSA